MLLICIIVYTRALRESIGRPDDPPTADRRDRQSLTAFHPLSALSIIREYQFDISW